MRVKSIVAACALIALWLTCARLGMAGEDERGPARVAATRAANAGTKPTATPPGDLTLNLVVEFSFRRIEPGEFWMGSPDGEPGHDANEYRHKVRLTRPFYIQAAEVSQFQYQSVMGANPSHLKGGDLPVDTVSWNDAARFCTKLGERLGRKVRLPTEAEWEYAARAGKDGPVAGTGKMDEMVRYADNSGTKRLDSAAIWDRTPNDYFTVLDANNCVPLKVGAGRPNDWGLRDMQGNVSEWVADWYADGYYREDAAAKDPAGPANSTLGSRVMRGGSFASDPRRCRLAYRDWNEPDRALGNVGFRVVVEADR